MHDDLVYMLVHALKCNFLTYVKICLFCLFIQDPKRHLEEKVDVLMTTNIVQCLGAMLDTVVFS